MKDFIKWLGVNEKIAKVIVWLMIIMIMLILTNTMLESMGLPYYAITYDNLVKINAVKLINVIISCIVCILNFYSVMLLVFRVKEAKRIFKYALLYLALNWIIKAIFGYVVMQVFIVVFDMIFCYLYSKKKLKYILYGICSLIFNTLIQGIWYVSKVRFIDYSNISSITKSILSLDYFVIMAVIILVKEIWLKKRGEKTCGMGQDVGFGSENSKTKVNLQKKSQRKSQAQLKKE